MRFADAKRWLLERSAAVAGIQPGEEKVARMWAVPHEMHVAMLSGVLEGPDRDPALDDLGSRAVQITNLTVNYLVRMDEAEEPEEREELALSACATVHSALVQAFALGLKMAEPEESR